MDLDEKRKWFSLKFPQIQIHRQVERIRRFFTCTWSEIVNFSIQCIRVGGTYFRKSEKRVMLSSADDVARYARENIYPEGSIEYVEQFYILLLDRSNQLFAWKHISVGGISATFTDPKLIFQTALLCHATQLILVHNHPSGNIQPSLADKMMTKKLKKGKIV